MLNFSSKKKALEIHKNAAEQYDEAYKRLEITGDSLYQMRRSAIALIRKIEDLINSIANTPKEFEMQLQKIINERDKFKKTEDYARETYNATIKSGAGVAAGVSAGVAFASLAPSAAMWVATTFGTASTGTAISALSGAVATKAALAWLGGGALSAGGLGIAGGKALLALAGPIGWSIAGVSVVASGASIGVKNKRIADKAIEEAKKIHEARESVREVTAKVSKLYDETVALYDKLESYYKDCSALRGGDYDQFETSDKLALGTLVNNTETLACLNNTIVE